ncbi:MAG: CapA family protein [Pseudorhizobium sp.]
MPITVAVTGQILIHGPLDLSGEGQRQVIDFLKADVAFGNLEATVRTTGSWPTKAKTLHLASPEALLSVRELGLHAVTHANNHAFDLGPPGIDATRTAAEGAGLKLAGSGVGIEQAAAPAIVRPAGKPDEKALAIFSVDLGPQPDITYASGDRAGIAPLRVKRSVAVPPAEFDVLQRIVHDLGDDRRSAARAAVGYDLGQAPDLTIFGTPIVRGDHIAAQWAPDEGDLLRLTAGIEGAKAAGHLVAVALHGHHWDPDWTETPAWLLHLCRRLIDHGTDLVLGTGAPVMQPLTFHRGRAIIPGLGNFVFHTDRPGTYDKNGVDVWRSAAVRLTLSDDGTCQALALLPIAVGRPGSVDPARGPVPANGADADEIRYRAFSNCVVPWRSFCS